MTTAIYGNRVIESVVSESCCDSTQKSGVGGLSKSDEGGAATQSQLHSANIGGAGNTQIQSGNDLSLIAANVTANGNINLEAVDQLLIAAEQTLSSAKQWKNESSAFSGGHLYEMQEYAEGETVVDAQASSLKAGGAIAARAGSGRVIGSDIHGEQGVDLRADAGDFTVEAAQTSRSHSVHEKEITVSLGDAAGDGIGNPGALVKTDDGRLTIKIAGAHFSESDTQSNSTTMRGSQISSGGDVSIAASAGSVNIKGSNLAADTDGENSGDINLSAAQDINITEATDTASSESKTTTGDAELSLVVQNQAVEVVKAYERLEDAKEQLEESKRQYKDYKRNLDQLERQLSQLEQDFADKKPGVNNDDLVELRALVDEVRDDEEWYQAGMVLAAANLVSATNALAVEIVALGSSGQTLGFNAGLQLDIDATKTRNESQSSTAVASTLSGQNIRINTGAGGNAEGTQTNIQGSQLQATDKIAINTGDLNVTASKNTAQSGSETEQGHITAQMTVYGAAGGASVNANFSRSQNSARETTYNNSFLLADNIDLKTTGDATLRGATVRAESELNADIGGNLTVESVQNRSSSRNSSAGVSGGFSLGGDGAANKGNRFTKNLQSSDDVGGLSGVNVGANSGNGMSNTRQTVLTSLTSGGTANIKVQHHTQITGALVATTDADGNDLNKLNLATNTIGFTDLRDRSVSSQTYAGLSTNFNMEPTGSDDSSVQQPTVATGPDGEELKPGTSNVVYNNSQHNSASNTLATLGHGNITVGGTQLEQDGELTEEGKAEDSALAIVNRDTSDTSKELWTSDQEQEVDATIDHRLLDPSRWEEITEDYKKAADAAQGMYNDAVDKAEYYRRELAAMGNDLPENLRERLGQTGEDLVDGLIRNGYTDEQIDALLAREKILSGLASVDVARGYSVEQLISGYREGRIEIPVTAVEVSATGSLGTPVLETFGVIGTRGESNILQTAVTGLGNIQQEIDVLMQIDPALAQGLIMGVQLITGGPVKTAIGYAYNAGVDALAGEEITSATDAAYQYAGSIVQQDSYEGFGKDLAAEQQQGKSETPGTSSVDTVDGIRLAVMVLGVADDRIGNGKSDSSSNRIVDASTNGQESNPVNGNGPRDEFAGPQNSAATRADLEAVHGVDNVQSTTVVQNPRQTVNSDPQKNIEVIVDSYGNKAVRVEYKDPVTGERKVANIAYDQRGLPVFDDHAKYTTNIKKPDGYENMSSYARKSAEMRAATRDLREKINSGAVDGSDFTPTQLRAINAGKENIPGYTWHHNAQSAPNNMQLLPKDVHDAAKHVGEASLSEGR